MRNHTNVERLIASRLLRTSKDVVLFESSVASIFQAGDPSDIEVLCHGFHDLTESDDVMFGLVHTIESYDAICGTDVSLRILAESMSVMTPHATEWLVVLHSRILNNDVSRIAYKRVFSALDDAMRSRVIEVLMIIRNDDRCQSKTHVDFILS